MKKITILWSWLFVILFTAGLTTQAQVHEGGQPIDPQHHDNVMNDRSGWIETTITVTVDYFASEASWNLYNVNTDSYFYSVDQTFAESDETVTEIVYLSEGNYEIHTYDSWGDGGIEGTVEADGETLVSWGEDDYDDSGEFPFALTTEDWNFIAYPDSENTPEDASIILEWGSADRDIVSYNIYRGDGGGSGITFDSIDNVDASVGQYVDSDVTPNATYSYYITGVLGSDEETGPSQIVVTTAATSPEFSIAPGSYNFGPVGLLEGEVFYGVDNASFSVTNTGVGELNITEEPYTFSGQHEAFNYEGTASFPYPITGPYNSTGDEFNFEMAFTPTEPGEYSTLLVVTDDLDRVVRTFPLQGSAYEIPDYDLVENAYMIDQDWGLNNDYMVEDMSFDNFANDYELGTPSKNDVVFHVEVAKDSYIQFTDAMGVSDFAVFPDGTTDFVEGNNVYEDGQTAIPSGGYYIIASGSGDFEFNIHIEGQEPELVVEPETLNLGDVPIGAWHEGGTFKVYNAGGQSITIEEASISDENGVFQLDHHYEFPVEITTDTLYFDIYLDAATAGTYDGAFLLTDTTTTHIYDFMGTAYEPVQGDILEDPFIVSFDGSNHYDDENSVDDPMRDNYHLVDGYGDVVYKFSYATDMVIDIALDEYDEGMDPQMALYDAEDVMNLSPDQLEPIATAADSLMDEELWAGTYYLMLAGDMANPNYNINFDVEDMPAPGDVTLISPADESDNIPIDDATLSWELGDYTNNIDVYLGTQYPPQTKILDSVEPTTSTTVDDLLPAQVYFWKVVAHNANGSSESETWGFTTELPSPNQVTGEIFDFVNVHLEWVNPFMERVEWTEGFEGGEIPEGWSTMTNATGSTAGWVVTEDGSSQYFSIPPHTYYAVANDDMEGSGSDGSMDYLIAPEEGFEDWETIELTFDSYYTGDYGHKAYVELSTDGGDTWEMVHEISANSDWTEVSVDLSDYNTEDYSSVWIGFHSDDEGGWASGWAVDNVNLFKERNLTNRALQGYNVYQNGEVINDEIVEQEFYDVYDLAAGTYTFGVSAVYNEGESDVVTIDEIEILGMGGIEGNVTNVDTDEPIEGANIHIASNDPGVFDTTLVTDTAGYYALETPVLENNYTVTASATGYADAEETDVEIEPETYTVLDFVLGDIPLPVTNVVADNNDEDTEATITWGEPGQGELMELVQHDNVAENGYFQSFNNGYGVVYDLTEYSDAMLQKIDFHHASWGTTGTWEYKLHIVNWDTYEEIAVVGPIETTGDDIWEENVSIGPISGLGGHQVGVFLEPLGNTADDAYPVLSSDNSGPDGMSLFGELGDWENFSTSGIGDFLMDLWITTAYGDMPVQASKVETPAGTVDATPRMSSNASYNGEMITINQKATTYEGGDRELQNYELYRLEQGQEDNTENWTLVDDEITETEYVDTEWADLEMGVYKYAVKAIYTITESEPVISNKVGKNMASQAVVIVSLNTGDNPEGATVLFENINEPEYTYEHSVPPSGTVQIDSLWKGTYDLTVSKEDYNTYNEYNIEIMENYFVRDVELQETLAIPVNLDATVDCKDVHLTWEQGTSGGSGNAEFADDFEAGAFADEWTIEQGPGNGWEVSEEYAYEGSYGAYTPWGMGIDTWMITPEVDISANHVISFAWQSSYYWSVDPNDNADLFVKISTDGGNSWESLWTFGEIGEWESWTWYETTLDLSEYDGETVKLAFNLVADDNADVGMDNVFVGEQAGRSLGTVKATTSPDVVADARTAPQGQEFEYINNRNSGRELLGYNVYRDGVLLNNEPIAETEYYDNDVAGGTFSYEVSAVYSTGESALAGPLDVEVEVINPPQNLVAEKQSWNNVELTWEAPSDQPIYTLQWDNGENNTSIGTGEAFDFDAASRWTPEDLAPFDGMYLTEISFYPAEEQSEYYLRVWTGEAATLVVDQQVTDVNIDAWNTVELETPVQIDASEELWFGYRANAETGYPAGCDAGPALTGKGDMINDPEAGWVAMSEAYGLDFNWNLAGTVTNMEEGYQANLGEIQDVERNSNRSGGEFTTSGEINSDPQMLTFDRELSGYNVYRNGTQLNDSPINVTYYWDLDLPIEPGVGAEFEYYVEAVFSGGCTSPSDVEVVDYGTDAGSKNAGTINVYPNPAYDHVKAAIPNNIESLRVINYVGQQLYQKNITSETVVNINTERFEAGAYLIQFTTDNGDLINKRFIITK